MNIKNFFSSPGKKTFGLIALLVVVLGLGYGGYRRATNNPLLGDLQLIFQSQQVATPNNNLDFQAQPVEQKGAPQNQLQVQVNPNVGSTINVIPSGNIKGLPISDQSKVSVWLAAGQGMKYDGDKLVEWKDISGNGRNVVAPSKDKAPKLSKQSGADCGDFNCQYGAYFDGVNDYMESVKEVDKVKEMFIVFDIDNKLYAPDNVQQGENGDYLINTGGHEHIISFDLDEKNFPSEGNNDAIAVGSHRRNGLSVDRNGDGYPDVYSGGALNFVWSSWSKNSEEDYQTCKQNGGGVNPCMYENRAWVEAKEVEPAKNPVLVHVKMDQNSVTEFSVNGREDIPLAKVPYLIEELTGRKFFLGNHPEAIPYTPERFFQGKIGEVVILNKNASASETDKIESYLETKFGISQGDAYPFPNKVGAESYVMSSPFFNLLQVASFTANYAHGIFGAGKLEEIGLSVGTSSGNFSTSTQREKFVSIGQAVGMDNGEFIYAGHNITVAGGNTWSNKFTSDKNAELLTRTWQMEKKMGNGIDSVVMSVKLGSSEFNVSKPAADKDYAIALFNGQNFITNAIYYGLLRDDGQGGDLTANDSIYSTRIKGSDISNATHFTLVRGAKGSFLNPNPGPNGPENILNPNLPQNPTGTLKVEVKTKDDKNTALNVGFDYNNGAVKHATPHTFNVDIATLNSEKRLKFDAKTDYLTPSDVTLNNYSVSNAPKNVQVTLNGNAMPFGTKFKDGDKLTLVGTYYNNANPPADTATINVGVSGPNGLTGANVSIDNNVANNVFIGNQGAKNFVVPSGQNYTVTCQQVTGFTLTTNPHPIVIKNVAQGAVVNVTCNYITSQEIDNAENKLTFRILSEDQQGNPLTENYSYNGEAYAKTPAAFNKEYTDFVNLTKKVAYGPKAGYVTPGEVTIADRKITTLPKNVKLYLNGPNSVYTLGTQLNKEDTLFIVGTYVKSATITVGVEGPNGLPTVEVDIPGVVDNEPISNGNKKAFEVDPNGNYQVICPEVNGYKLITDPNPFPVNNLNPGENKDVTCKYIVKNGDTTVTVGVEGPNGLGEVKVVIPGVTNGTDIDNGDSETFKVDPNKSYKVYCEEVDGYILVTNPHPIIINPLDPGSNTNVKCKYVTDTGADEYDPNEDYDFFGNEESCLTYEERNLLFSDLQPNQLGYAAAEVLKNTAFSPKVTNSDIKKAVKNYPLSGFGSDITGNNQTQAEVRLPAQVIRADVTLLTMQLYCLPIFRGDSLPNTRLDGKPMPKVSDLPPVGTVAYDVIKSAFFYGILEGYRYGYSNNYVSWSAPITNWQFIKVVNNAEQNWQGYQNISDFDLARQYGFDTGDWVYTFVARALRKHYPDSAILETPSLLRTTERNITRGEMVNHLFHSVIRDGLYYPQDEVEAWDAYQNLID